MGFIIDFLRQKAPRPGKEMPGYYQKALVTCEGLMAVYFVLYFFLFRWQLGHYLWVPLVALAINGLSRLSVGRANVRVATGLYALATALWVGWYALNFGWGCGGQHFLIPLLVMCFFNIYEPPWWKIVLLVLLVTCRMLLFSWCQHHDPIIEVSASAAILFQNVNSMTLFGMMACQFILFSSSIQDTERQLRLDNQELHKEAGTDPLTQLPNRRAMLDGMEEALGANPQMHFCVAIADIDFFKRVNDTYGHNCGDYTLKTLSDLFRDFAEGRYQVCRWGGEEFCFFLPEMNLDQAGQVMFDLCGEVRKLPLSFGGNDFSITITIGVEETDFLSPMAAILERADQKLYRGKIGGRNQVVL
ncbi:MAG: GGDEF domain-containing protein [Clostridia bacterium]|nr:GGDEF domain-containing protein [Clostridia bacterium]